MLAQAISRTSATTTMIVCRALGPATQAQLGPCSSVDFLAWMPRPALTGGRPPLRPLLRDDAAFARLVPRPRSAPTPTNRNESRRVAYTSRRDAVTSAVNCGLRPSVPKAARWAASAGLVTCRRTLRILTALVRKQLEEQQKQITDLERQLALRQQNSTTTSKPPSSDGLAGQQCIRGAFKSASATRWSAGPSRTPSRARPYRARGYDH